VKEDARAFVEGLQDATLIGNFPPGFLEVSRAIGGRQSWLAPGGFKTFISIAKATSGLT